MTPKRWGSGLALQRGHCLCRWRNESIGSATTAENGQKSRVEARSLRRDRSHPANPFAPTIGSPMNEMTRLAFLPIALAAVGAAPQASAAPATTTPSAACGAEYHQLDFWIGDWDTFETDPPGGPSVARAHVDPIAQGCAIHELYEQNDRLIGDSILSYDAVRKQWQQTWVTNRGSLMVITGHFKDGALVLEGEAHLKDGKSVMQRITWKAQNEGVRESAVMSKDGGKTWVPAFDVLFLEHVASQ